MLFCCGVIVLSLWCGVVLWCDFVVVPLRCGVIVLIHRVAVSLCCGVTVLLSVMGNGVLALCRRATWYIAVIALWLHCVVESLCYDAEL